MYDIAVTRANANPFRCIWKTNNPFIIIAHGNRINRFHGHAFRARRLSRRLRVSAERWRGSNGSSPSSSENKADLTSLVLPAVGGIALAAFAVPYLGSSLGFVVIVTAIAAVTGILDEVSKTLGTTLPASAGIVSLGALGILLIPAFLKIAVAGGIGFLVFNFFVGLFANKGDTDSMQEVDPRDVTIDVEYESIDD